MRICTVCFGLELRNKIHHILLFGGLKHFMFQSQHVSHHTEKQESRKKSHIPAAFSTDFISHYLGEYCKCSSVSNATLIMLKIKWWFSRLEFTKVLKKQSDQGLHCLSRPFWHATSVHNFRIFTVAEPNLYPANSYQICIIANYRYIQNVLEYVCFVRFF